MQIHVRFKKCWIDLQRARRVRRKQFLTEANELRILEAAFENNYISISEIDRNMHGYLNAFCASYSSKVQVPTVLHQELQPQDFQVKQNFFK